MNCLTGPEQRLLIAIGMRGALGDGVHVASQPVAYRTTDERPDFTASPNFPYQLDPMQLLRQ